MSEKFLDQSGLVVLRNWVLGQISYAQLGGGVSPSAMLLWENSSPLATFDPQDIEISDLSDNYPAVVIEYAPYNNDDTSLATVFSDPTPIWHGGILPAVSLSSANYGGRYFSVMGDRVRFMWGHNHAAGIQANIAVPIAIYGVNYATEFVRPDIVTGRNYLIAPGRYNSSVLQEIGGTEANHAPTNGSAYLFTGWMTTRCGTGLTVVTPWASNSYGFGLTPEYFDLTDADTLVIKGYARCYNGTDYIGLRQVNSQSLMASGNAAAMADYLSPRQDIVSSGNTLTAINITFDVSSLSGNYKLGIMCAGSGSNTGYPGIVCITEAYTTSNEAQVSEL